MNRKWTKHKWKAIHRTTSVTAPIFILSVHLLLLVLFEQNFLAYILILLFLLLGLSLIVQYKVHEEIHLRRVFKGFWRVSFLLFTFFYVGLTMYGLLERLFS
ncbi:DUF3397 domain-containing protein [Halobacillus sp. BBL2006]|uniref:DUF3397 domain-containing protein n=1 Tax=Halobacillus sp. BBL2006 TaxID=1543706 RepID=UPI001E2E0669|nr:DUF3397 domain-containing protein [Halobacillus sp. BBL2006]